MSSQHVHFKVGSRKAFAEESPVVDAAERAAVEVAEKRGNSADGALFKVIIRGAGSGTVPAQAVDIIRDAFDKFNAANVGGGTGHVQSVAAEAAGHGHTQALRRSGTDKANRKLVESLRRLGFQT